MTRPEGRSNTRTTLKRRSRSGNPMAAYDRLPPELRAWLAEAALPWSAHSALRLWRKSLQRHGGDIGKARSQLSRIERRRLSQDARRVWGDSHPAASEAAL